MNTPTAVAEPPAPRLPSKQRTRWWQRPWILPLSLFTVIFLGFAVPPYATLDPELSRFPIREDLAWHYPLMVTHIFGGTIAMLAVCLQVWPWLRRHYPAMHRWSGRVYVFVGVPFVGIPGLILAPLGHTGFGTQVSTVLWALLWLGCTIAGYRMVRQRRYAEHREWMLRSFALILAIAMNRPWAVLCTMALMPQLDTTFGGDIDAMILAIAPTSAWLSWVVNLLIVEWWIQYRKGGGARRRTRSAQVA